MIRSLTSRVFYSTRSYYELLQVPTKASQDEIKNAYLKLSKLKPQDKTLHEAYEILSKPTLRFKYDKGILGVRNGNIIEYDHSVWDDAVFRQRPMSSGEERQVKAQAYENFGVQWLIVSISLLLVLLVKVIEDILDNKQKPNQK